MRGQGFLTGIMFALVLSCSLECFGWPEEELEINCEVLDQFYTLWSESRYGEDPTLEKSAWVIRDSDGDNELMHWPSTRKWRMEVWKGSIPDNVIAQAHTHPVKTDPRPSAKDHIFSRSVNAPLYTVSRKGIWMVTPDGTVQKVAGSNWHINLYQATCRAFR